MRTSVASSVVLAASVALTPALAAATSLINTLAFFNFLLNAGIGLLVTAAILAFFYGLVMYLLSINNQEKRKEGISIMIYGILAITVMVSVWGLVRLLQNTFGVTSTDPIVPQGIQLNTSGN